MLATTPYGQLHATNWCFLVRALLPLTARLWRSANDLSLRAKYHQDHLRHVHLAIKNNTYIRHKLATTCTSFPTAKHSILQTVLKGNNSPHQPTRGPNQSPSFSNLRQVRHMPLLNKSTLPLRCRTHVYALLSMTKFHFSTRPHRPYGIKPMITFS